MRTCRDDSGSTPSRLANLNRLGQSSSREKEPALPGPPEIPANSVGRQPYEEVPGSQCDRNVPLSKHFVYRIGVAGHVESEIENAGSDPQANVSGEDRLQDCSKNQSAAHPIADQSTKE